MTNDQIEPTTRWGRRWLPAGPIAVVVAAIVIAGTLFYLQARRKCADEVTRFDGTQECVGITDGAFHFELDGPGGQDARLKEVLELIREENQRVRDSEQPWFSVAFALPMPWGGKGNFQSVSVVSQLQGAYAAQVRANEDNELKVRLLVANIGHDGVAWEQVAADLIERRAAYRLAAVAGLGQSRRSTENFASRLSQAAIPVVGSTITADELNGFRYPNLYRVSPTNADEVAVGLRYLLAAQDPAAVNAYLVTAGSADDTYVDALKEAFRDALQDDFSFSARSLNPEETGHNQTLKVLAGNLCVPGPPVVAYFAGRSSSLRTFLAALRDQCPRNHSVTVLSADDASVLVGQPIPEQPVQSDGKAIKFLYTGLTHPDQWTTEPVELSELKRILREAMNRPASDLASGSAIMAYDAVTVAVRALLNVEPSTSELDEIDSLRNGFAQINNDSPYCGASGPIAFEATQSEATGNSVNKPIPVIEIAPDGVERVRALLAPVEPADGGVSWAGKCGDQQGVTG